MLVPDIFIDTMGYAFTLAFSKFLFPDVPTGAYVHYPTISTDMLGSLDAGSGKGLNAGAGKGWKGKLKRAYWQAFAWLYGWVGGEIDVVMTNSSWTQAHINSLWSAHRAKRQTLWPIEVVYPPVAVNELQQAIPFTEEKREPIIVCIAQFRPEKKSRARNPFFCQIHRPCHQYRQHGTRDSKNKTRPCRERAQQRRRNESIRPTSPRA